jgi:hypothetical protein
MATALLAVTLIATLPAPASAYNLGDTTPNWTMLEGRQQISYNLYDYRGKIVLVNCFASW